MKDRKELIRMATAFKQDTNNKDFESIPHLMADFLIAQPKEIRFPDYRIVEEDVFYHQENAFNAGFNKAIDEIKKLNTDDVGKADVVDFDMIHNAQSNLLHCGNCNNNTFWNMNGKLICTQCKYTFHSKHEEDKSYNNTDSDYDQ
jgi:hypothetical protein